MLPPSRKKQVAAVAHGGEGNGGPNRGSLRGLDPSTVQNALQAGIPAAHLCEVGKIMKERPKRLEEVPRGRREAQGGPLSEEEDFPPGGELDVEGPGDGGGGVNTVEKALLELTKIAGRLAANKTKRDQLEALLDGVGSGSAAGSEGSSGAGKRNAASHVRWVWQVAGLPDSREERGSPCEVRTAGGGGRSGQHRSGKLADFQCFPAGASASISTVSLRPSLGGLVSQSPQGSRCLCGDKEEAGEQVEHYKRGESAGWRRSTESQEESKSQKEGPRRRTSEW